MHPCIHDQSLQCAQLFETLWTVACQAPLSVGMLQARIVEWVAMPSNRGSSQSRDHTHVTYTAGRSFTTEPPQNPQAQRWIYKWA